MSTALIDLARLELARCHAILDQNRPQLAEQLPPESLTVECDLKGRLRGLAVFRSRLIRLNVSYFEAVGERYRQTIAHEYAHHVAFAAGFHMRGERPHGPTWQHFMRLFGHKPERFSDYGDVIVRARKTRFFVYEGVNCGRRHYLGARRHAQAERGQHYLCCCPDCKRRPPHERGIAFTGEVEA